MLKCIIHIIFWGALYWYLISYQYKFIVDGEWRHDERQPCVSSNYGTVNTVMLSRDSGYNSAILSPQIPSGSSMDVDNAVFQRLVRHLFAVLLQ